MTENPFFDDIFRVLDDSNMGFGGFGFGDIKFVVADTNPKQAVIITDQTDVVFNPEAAESGSPDLEADTEVFCEKCAWHDKFEELKNR